MAAALELSLAGHNVTLYESHSIPGGCASWYRRSTAHGPFQFDVGATVLNGLEDGQALKQFLDKHEIQPAPFEAMEQIFYQIADKKLRFDTRNSSLWTQSLVENFPHDRAFIDSVFPKLERIANVLYRALETPVHWPIQNFSDAFLNLRLLPHVLPAAPAILSSGSLMFGDILNRHSLSPEMRTFLDMTFLISAQCKPEQVPTPWAALALYFYPLGAGTTYGGMRGFHESLFRKLKERKNVSVKMLTKVTRLDMSNSEIQQSSWKITSEAVKTGTPHSDAFHGVVSAIPRFNTEALLDDQHLASPNLGWDALGKNLWGAYTGYVGLKDQKDWPDEAFNVHSRLGHSDHPENGEELYISVGKRNDSSRAPEGLRSLTASTHCGLSENASYQREEFKTKLLQHLSNWGVPETNILHLELGDPKTFENFTSRLHGNVGGLPMTWEHTIAQPAPQRSVFPGLYQIGDTSFPGQSVYACVMGARSVVEKIHKDL